ncbi:anaerobic ribonucleoside-triphosphate reductase activating protein [Corynebacterium guangdongense]|uniref:Anaerobic ribonucleoside-triphosphate reductase-activating protein n=1 Tax=Corynebacterium guangdongense TaxID=1783348 RepID=A0ABU1ZZF1_9CORY|nr:anaerobic ribonucleoside-triphosphate reductase activating protein [Corynebacterium guangdongense]MDR7330140.1 anaerobic ribonucleoside-triphosphate reductase activating protein [Corynebacterium guangdongense]WJZ18698.1 anaerobic ribonucleotide reductase-activating protein [Corynebacterium guangdongense]
MSELSDARRSRIEAMDERSRTWEQTDEFRVADYKPFQALDGEGLRCSLYVSYCPFNCLGCYNKAAQKKGYGNPYTAELEERILRDLANPHVAGLTLVGGEPFLSARWLLPLVRRIREELPGKTVWSYSGYTWEILRLFGDERRSLLESLDVLIDGQFIQEERDEGNLKPFAGSANQRLIDVPVSLVAGAPVKYEVATLV